MQWESWSAFWDMGGRAWYVWGSYGATLALIALEIILLLRQRRIQRQKLRRLTMLEDDTQADTAAPPQ